MVVEKWRDKAEWEHLRLPDGCPICQRGEPLDVLAELPASWATGGIEAALPGYVCVVAKTHAVEPFELPDRERAAFWADAMKVSEAVASVTGAIKMNYAIYGNTIPHVHMHLFPRYVDDPYRGVHVATQHSFRRSPEELERLAAAIRPSGHPSLTR
jgi:diadenosine tetraphosphate (Ap4A) HIT family hydrolase